MKVIAADDEKDDGEDDEEARAGPGVLHQQLAEDPIGAGQATSNACTAVCMIAIEKSSFRIF